MTTLTNALPSLLTDALPLLFRLVRRILPPLLVISGGCFAAVELLLLVDAWPPSSCFRGLSRRLGDVVLHVGSSVLGRLVGLGGSVRSSLSVL